MRAMPSAIAARSHSVAVLLCQRDQLAVLASAGEPPGIGKQHQRQQAGDLAVAGQQADAPSA